MGLTAEEQDACTAMRARGASWFLVAMMLTSDRLHNARSFAYPSPSFATYLSVVGGLTAIFGPQDFKP